MKISLLKCNNTKRAYWIIHTIEHLRIGIKTIYTKMYMFLCKLNMKGEKISCQKCDFHTFIRSDYVIIF